MTDIEHEQVQANIGKLMAETMKLNAEGAKMQRERAYYPAVLLVSALGAGAALATAFYHLLQ